ncbi:MAG: hypothetical protein SNJ82_14645, partial [Gemmataceae bacterium]
LLWWEDHHMLFLEVGTWKTRHYQQVSHRLFQAQADRLGGFELASDCQRWAVDEYGRALRPLREGFAIPVGQLSNGCQLALEDYDRLSVWDCSLQRRYPLLAPRRRMTHDSPLVAAWDRRGHLALTFDSPNRLARLWNLASASIACEFYTPGSPGHNACAIAPDGSAFALLEHVGVRLHEVRPQPEFDWTAMQIGELRNLSTHPEYPWLATQARFPGESSFEIRVVEPVQNQSLSYRSDWQALANPRVSPLLLTGPSPRVLRIVARHGNPTTLLQEDLFSSRPDIRTPLGSKPFTADLCLGREGTLWSILERLRQVSPTGQIGLEWKFDEGEQLITNIGLHAVHARGERVVVGCRDGSAVVFHEQEKKLEKLYRSKGADVPVSKVWLASDDRTLFFGRVNGTIEVHDLHRLEQVQSQQIHRAEVTGLVQTPDGVVISSTLQGEIAFWTFAQGTLSLLARFQGPPQRCHLALAADGVTLYSLHENDHGVRVWHLQKLFDRWVELGLGRDLPKLRARPVPQVPLKPPPCPPVAPQAGWQGQRFRMTNFLGALPIRVDPSLDFSPANRPLPLHLLNQPGGSYRASSWWVPPKSGLYKLRLQASMPVTLWLDGQRRIEFIAPGTNDWSIEAMLEAKPYAIRVEVPEFPPDGILRLTWIGPDQPTESLLGKPHVFTEASLAIEHAPK